MSLTIKKFVNTEAVVQDTIDEGNLKIGAAVVAQTKLLCPVNKQKGVGGRLRNSYMYITDKGEGGFNDSPGDQADKKLEGTPEKNTGYVGSNVDYSVYQEFGTSKMAPQPHLRPAIDLIVKGKKLDKVIQEVAALKAKHAKKKG